jgi:hypothetical protein
VKKRWGASRLAAGWPLAAVLLAALPAAGCATAGTPAGAAGPTTRAAPDDSDLWNLAPAGATSIADVDMVALSRSPWSSSLMKGGFEEDRAQRLRTFGYDVFTDVDRLLVVATEAAETGGALTVARGRFDAGKVASTFMGATPGAVAARWRESPLWEGSGRAVALVTPRTLAQGTPEAVRGAIDAAWGVTPDARSGPLGELRQELGAEHAGPAIMLALVVTGEVRDRAAGFIEVPDGLQRLGARLDLATDLNLRMRAVLGNGRQATDAAELWSGRLRELAQQRLARVMGLSPLLEGVSLKVDGAEVHGQLRVAEARREALSDRLLFLLRALASQRRGPVAP